MKIVFFIIIAIFCQLQQNNDIPQYYALVNQAENHICLSNFNEAINKYEAAFKLIDKPFGKDVFNTALVCAKLGNKEKLLYYLQKIINNSDELDFVQNVFVETYINIDEWNQLVKSKQIEYNPALRIQLKELYERDQLFRPLYETHNDTIQANFRINMKQIFELTNTKAFPSHQELGYTEYLREQNHYIVLHHSGQLRSRDKNIQDLEPLLKKAVEHGRFDPEYAIFYLNFQNDNEKGPYEVYSTMQFKHPLLPDSLNNKIWLENLNQDDIEKANVQRGKWYACTLEDISLKSNFLTQTKDPFIFTSVRQTIAQFSEDMDKETAMEQYKMATSYMKEYRH